MLTSALITLVQKQYPDVSRVIILELMNEIQKMIYTQNAVSSMKMISSTTGIDPVLTTVAGTYSYDIATTTGFEHNAWRITDVYTSDISEPEDVTLFDATPSEAAKVIFKENPGTGNYYIRAYKFPTDVSSESIQLTVPNAYHLSHIFEGICGFIEKLRSGKSERYDIFMKSLLPEVVKKLSDTKETFFFVTPKGY